MVAAVRTSPEIAVATGQDGTRGNVIDLAARVAATRASLSRIYGPTIIKGAAAIDARMTNLLRRVEEVELAGDIDPVLLGAVLDQIEFLVDAYGRFVSVARDTLVGPGPASEAGRATGSGRSTVQPSNEPRSSSDVWRSRN